MNQQSTGEFIIVIDDQEEFREVAKALLETQGYSVLTAGNGEEGVELYSQHRGEVTVVVTDMEMPVMNGVATIKRLLEINPDIKVIASSGQDSYASLPQNYPRSAVTFLRKPYHFEEFVSALEDLKHKT